MLLSRRNKKQERKNEKGIRIKNEKGRRRKKEEEIYCTGVTKYNSLTICRIIAKGITYFFLQKDLEVLDSLNKDG